MGRATHETVAHALTRYTHALAQHGYNVPDPGDPGGPMLAAPYGQVYYVVRYDGHLPVHDLPGFVGTAGAGFLTRREAITAINAAASTLYDLASWLDYGMRDRDPEEVTR